MSPDTWQPLRFQLPRDQERLDQLRNHGAIWREHDTCASQLRNWIKTQSPERTFSSEALDRRVSKMLGESPECYGVWVLFPWSGRLVHLLPADQFCALRGNRNHYLISPEEQVKLASKRVGVVGLSVGQAVSNCLALEGVGGTFVLADFDDLELSNLNRIQGSVAEIGLPKVIMAARRIYELNPFATVVPYPDGLNSDNIDAFLADMDLLVEACDDLEMKVRLRSEARARRIPVVMPTTDQGLLDVERFDLDPGLPLFHGLLGDQIDASQLTGLSKEEKLPFIARLVEAEHSAPRMVASLVEIESSLSTWPQLGSAVQLGAGLVTDAARKILVGEPLPSGRFRIDPDHLVTAEHRAKINFASVESPSPRPALVALPKPGAELDRELVAALVERAMLAPSGGNAQPWTFEWDGARLQCGVDLERNAAVVDPTAGSARLSLGCAVENLAIAATQVGLRAEVSGEAPQWSVALESHPGAPDRLGAAVEVRATERHLNPRAPFDAGVSSALILAAAEHDGEAIIKSDAESLKHAADACALAGVAAMLHRGLYPEMMDEFRWTPAEARETRDGLDVAALDVRAADKVGLQMLRRPEVIEALRRLDRGTGLGKLARRWAENASALVLLRVSPSAWEGLNAGRSLQRMWLTATANGWAMQPIGRVPYLLARMRAEPDFFDATGQRLLNEAGEAWSRAFAPSDQVDAIFLRIVKSSGMAPHALRRPVSELLRFAEPT